MATIETDDATAAGVPPPHNAPTLSENEHITMVQKLTLVSWGEGDSPPPPVADDGSDAVNTTTFLRSVERTSG